MPLSTRAVVAREAIEKIVVSGLEPHELLHEVATRVRNAVPFEYGGSLLLDPDTVLPTGHLCGRNPLELSRQLLHNEILTPDVHKFAELARRPSPVAALSMLDSAALEQSTRRRTILDPSGLGDEARVVFRAHGSTWGATCLIRERGMRSFDAEELDFLANVAVEVGQGLRTSLSQRSDAAPTDPAPGVLLVDGHLNVVSATGAAQQWQSLMPSEAWVAMHTIVLRARAFPEDEEGRRVRVRLATGEWLVLHAAPLDGGEDGPSLTAITLEPAQRSELVRLLLRLHGLSAREHEVADLLLRGLATDEIASKLCISRHTLRDHLKSIFGKVGVGSRPELMAVLAGDAQAGAGGREQPALALSRT